MEAGLVAILTGEATVSALVSSRVYVNKAPQTATLPYIVITQMSSDEMGAMDGTTGLRAVTFDIDCKADRSVEATSLSDAVRAFVRDYTGAAGSETIQAVLLESEAADFEPPTDGSDRGIHTKTLDVTIQYAPS
jgi:hypothetical protein